MEFWAGKLFHYSREGGFRIEIGELGLARRFWPPNNSNVDPGNSKQPNLLFSSTLKSDIVTTTHHENEILDGG